MGALKGIGRGDLQWERRLEVRWLERDGDCEGAEGCKGVDFLTNSVVRACAMEEPGWIG